MLPAAPAAGQFAPETAVGAFFETYSFTESQQMDIDRLTLLSLPFGVGVPLGRRVALNISGAWARGELSRPGGQTAEISGLTDTDVRLSAVLGRDVVTVTAILQLPTGVAELDDAEADAAGMFAADVLPFHVTNWGAGGGLGLSTAFARPVGEYAVGLSVGYVVAREFEPQSAGPAYRPGDQLHVRAAIDRTFGTSSKGALVLTWQRFGEDQLDSQNLFQTGNRLQALASWAFAAGASGTAIAYAGYLHRADGSYVADNTLVPSRGLMFAGAGARLPAGSTILQPSLDLRLQTGDAATGYTVGVGGAVELPLGRIRLLPTARGRFGSVQLENGLDSGFTGAELGVAIRF